jgi:hypothetical protein
MKKLKDNQLLKISETFEDFKALVPRFISVKDDSEKFRLFCTRNRNQIWDLQMFKTGLISEAAKGVKRELRTEEHFFNRSLSSKIIFEMLVENPEMTLDEFIKILVKYTSTIILTKEEHNRLTPLTKGSFKKSYQDYVNCGIIIYGLEEYIISLEN